MKRLLLLLTLLIVACSPVDSYTTKKPEPLPSTAFSPVVVSSKTMDSPTPAPSPTSKPTAKPSVKTKPVTRQGTTSSAILAKGQASWYCKTGVSRCTRNHPGGMYAAIRRDLLYLRGKTIKVCDSNNCVYVTIIDCNCGPRANLIDLYSDAYRKLAPLSTGRINVRIYK